MRFKTPFFNIQVQVFKFQDPTMFRVVHNYLSKLGSFQVQISIISSSSFNLFKFKPFNIQAFNFKFNMQNLGHLGWATSPKLRFLALNSCRAHLFLRSRLAFESHVPKYKFQLCTFQYCNFNTAISISHFQFRTFNSSPLLA